MATRRSTNAFPSTDYQLSRRDTLIRFGVGGATAAFLVGNLSHVAAQDATPEGAKEKELIEVPEKLGFRWMSVSVNTAEGATDLFILNGDGEVANDEIVARGSFNNFDAAEPADPEAPRTLLSSGIWQAESLVSLELVGIYGANAAGTLVMDVMLYPVEESEMPAQITMNCNIPPAGLFTGLAEGFFLTVGDATYEPWVLPVAPGAGPPEIVAVGATVFNILDENQP